MADHTRFQTRSTGSSHIGFQLFSCGCGSQTGPAATAGPGFQTETRPGFRLLPIAANQPAAAFAAYFHARADGLGLRTCRDVINWRPAKTWGRSSGGRDRVWFGVMLTDLDYDWPCAFARFEIEIWNRDRDLFNHDELESIAQAIGHPVRQIIARI